MSLFTTTLGLFTEAARDTLRALPRTAWALLALVLATPILHVTGLAGGLAASGTGAGGGIVAGLIAALVHAVVVGWYLSLVEIGVVDRRRMAPRDLVDSIGRHWGSVISVLFVFWIASMLIGFVASPLVPILTLVATILFNPIPELIYQRGGDGMGLLGDAARFMQTNWPEWLAAHLLAAGILVLWGVLLAGGLGWTIGIQLIQVFGPFFGFVSIGAFALGLAGTSAKGVLLALFVLLFVHAFLLFRGFLFQRLVGSSRRSRAWQQRMR